MQNHMAEEGTDGECDVDESDEEDNGEEVHIPGS
jgi:hypothetical protein